MLEYMRKLEVCLEKVVDEKWNEDVVIEDEEVVVGLSCLVVLIDLEDEFLEDMRFLFYGFCEYRDLGFFFVGF